MPRKRNDKKITFLEPVFKDILVCKDKDMRPYLEIFVFEPENVSHNALGTFMGILEINDESEDSSYIVNYLISVIKKEYFINAKRGPIESFEAALHKANLALAKLAEHGQIGWIGQFNAILAVCEKNNIHLADTGRASAFLVRAKSLLNISSSETEEIDPNPLKTFEEVVSGRLEDGDKVILTTESMFNIFSLEEIKRSALKFSRTEFTQFLHTALVNELDRAAVLVVDIQEKIEEKSEEAHVARTPKFNAFSQKAFVKKEEKRRVVAPIAPPAPAERQELIAELKKELEKSQDGFVDEKTGHIYIKDEKYSVTEKTPGDEYFKNIYQKISSSSTNLFHDVTEKTKEKIASFSTPRPKISPPKRPASVSSKSNQDTSLDRKITLPGLPRINFKEKLIPVWLATKTFIISAAVHAKFFIVNKIIPFLRQIALAIEVFSRKITVAVIARYRAFLKTRKKSRDEKSAREEIREVPVRSVPDIAHDYAARPELQNSTREEKRKWFEQLAEKTEASSDPLPAPIKPANIIGDATINQPFSASASPIEAITIPEAKENIFEKQSEPKKKFLPSFSKIKNILARLDGKKKMAAVAVIILLIIVPYFLNKTINKVASPKEPVAVTAKTAEAPASNSLAQDKNAVTVEKLDPVYSGSNISKTININGYVWVVSESSIDFPGDNKSYDIPTAFQKPDLVFEMDNLNLIFFLKNNSITSFSVNNRKFQDNNISLPTGSSFPAGRAYLTYAYLLDTKNNQIYRYPRAEGGFGEKTDLVKDTIDLSKSKDMVVNDNVYVTDGKTILTISHGKKIDFNIDSTSTPISISKLYSKPDTDYIYILDRDNKRIIKLDKNGKIISQYYNAKFGDILDFSVNDENSKIYVSGSKNVDSFDMN